MASTTNAEFPQIDRLEWALEELKGGVTDVLAIGGRHVVSLSEGLNEMGDELHPETGLVDVPSQRLHRIAVMEAVVHVHQIW